MWNQLSLQQQQFLMAMLMGQQQPGMGWGIGNPLMAGGQQQTGGNWFDWLNSGGNGSAGPQMLGQGQVPQWMQQQATQNYTQQAALAQTQQTGYLPPEAWGQQQMAPQAQQQGLMGQLTNGMDQQRLPDYSGGGPNYSPYAMPGTVQWGG